MYSTLGKKCSFTEVNNHSNFYTQYELKHGLRNMDTSSEKFNISMSVYDLPPVQATNYFLNTPFNSPLLTPEEGKVIQDPNNAGNR